jgi:phosphatidate cytidylyltransferase
MAALDTETPNAAPAPKSGREILLRVITGVILAPVGLLIVYYGGSALAVGTSLCAVLAAAEWTRMAAGNGSLLARRVLFLVLGGGAMAATWLGQIGLPAVVLASLATSAAAAGVSLWAGRPASGMAFGAIYTSLPFGAFVWIRDSSELGLVYLVALLVVVWATDISAYFAGRGFGGPLLSPQDSPNKTWNGAIGAVICAGLAGAAVGRFTGASGYGWLVASLMLSVIAQLGDLLESRFKRTYGVKDTSGIIPGHGGVLDRLDSLMASTVVVAAILYLAPQLAPDAPAAMQG